MQKGMTQIAMPNRILRTTQLALLAVLIYGA